MNERPNIRSVVWIASLGAVFTMAFQVAGKAARDALFLTNFRPSQLPPMVVAGALSAIVLGLINARLLARYAPRQFVPSLILVSGGLQAVEWMFYAGAPGVTAIAVYIHVVALGAVITSGFWSVVNEQLDPWSAKQSFGKIAGAGTAGGVAGGFVAERLAVLASTESVLLAMSLFQFVTAVLLWFLPSGLTPHAKEKDTRAIDLLRKSSYMRNLSLLVLIGTFSAALLDYVLKADARHTLGPGEPLMRFFALFHTGTALLAFFLQTGVTTALLNRFGLGAAMTTLPASVSASGIIAALTGGFTSVVAARATEAVIRGSFFRAAYELLYTPMLAHEKRAIKSVNDVTVDRLGDALGGSFAQMAITLGPGLSSRVMLLTASAASAIGWIVSRRLHHGYIRSLERSLEHYAGEDDDTPTPYKMYADARPGKVEPLERSEVHPAILKLTDPLDGRASWRSLVAAAAYNTGQISDHLLDPQTPVEIRRLLPSILAAGGGERAAEALLAAIHDTDARVRTYSARALDDLRQRMHVDVDEEAIYEAIRRELRKQKPAMAHMTDLMSAILPRDPVRAAFESLTSEDPQRRGLALEYLETALPADIAEALIEKVHGSVPAI